MDINPMNAGIVHNFMTPYNKSYNKPRRVVFITLLTTSYIMSMLYVWYLEVMESCDITITCHYCDNLIGSLVISNIK